ncbi:hypothetical protein GCM10008906_28370 [Clostridium oceanicum]|uniref:Membrane-associated protein n=1 Tax=Clostridium oceanicum TaxID=1543 RepID=A0ABP3UZU3_9CLOT
MKFIFVNKRKLGLCLIILGLMVILFGFEKKFDDRLKMTSLVRNKISSLKEYKGLDYKLTYKLPESWNTKQYTFSGEDILYNNEFENKEQGIHGFVQVWNLEEDLKEFLTNSKKISDYSKIDYKNYKMIPINLNNKKGYLVKYSYQSKAGKFIAYEYFIGYKDKIFRFSFFIKDENFEESTETVLEFIVKTLQYKESNYD